MPAPAGMFTNIGKMVLVGGAVTAITSGALHVLGTEYGGTGRSGWKSLANITDAALVVAGGVVAVTGACMAANELAVAAHALGETPLRDAVRGGKVLAQAETLLGLGLGVVGGTVGTTLASSRLG